MDIRLIGNAHCAANSPTLRLRVKEDLGMNATTVATQGPMNREKTPTDGWKEHTSESEANSVPVEAHRADGKTNGPDDRPA